MLPQSPASLTILTQQGPDFCFSYAYSSSTFTDSVQHRDLDEPCQPLYPAQCIFWHTGGTQYMEERGQGREEYEEGTEGQQAVGLRKERELCRGELPGEEKGHREAYYPLTVTSLPE